MATQDTQTREQELEARIAQLETELAAKSPASVPTDLSMRLVKAGERARGGQGNVVAVPRVEFELTRGGESVKGYAIQVPHLRVILGKREELETLIAQV